MSDFSIYPDIIDGYAQLPLVVDTVTRIDAVSVNRLRSAVINIENELGVLPSGESFNTVRDRLDSLQEQIDDLEQAIVGTQVDTVNSSNTLTVSQNIILADASEGDIILELPNAALASNKINVKKIDSSSNTVTIIPSVVGQTIDGSSGVIINAENDSYALVSSENNWFII
jgi:hypothetical protein